MMMVNKIECDLKKLAKIPIHAPGCIPGLNCSDSALFIDIPTPSITARIMPPAIETQLFTSRYFYNVMHNT